MNTFGPAYDERVDGTRIRTQMEAVKRFMLSGPYWWTLEEIANETGEPPASVSAQLRHLRKERFGGYQVDKQRRGEGGLWEYRALEPVTTQKEMF